MSLKHELEDPANSSDESLSDKLIRGNVLASACPSRQVLKNLTSRWGVLVMIALSDKQLRFSELRRTIDGVSEKMLAQTLQNLEYNGMIERHDFQTVPPHVEYSLSPLGVEAATKVRDLADWIETNMQRIIPLS